jgi:hypothetical protein
MTDQPEQEAEAVHLQEDAAAVKHKAKVGKQHEHGLSKDMPMVVVSEDEELPMVSEVFSFFFF